MYGLPRPSRLRQQAGFFYVFFCFFLLDRACFFLIYILCLINGILRRIFFPAITLLPMVQMCAAVLTDLILSFVPSIRHTAPSL